MRKLSTIQKRENLNSVYAVDEKGNGNANHTYAIHNGDVSACFEQAFSLSLVFMIIYHV